MYLFAEPLAMLIRPIYEQVQNYGWTLVIVTVLINLLTIPLTIMSQKSTSKTQQIQPLITELQRKYANDKEKLNTEMQKIYTKYGINPMSGCLPMVVRLLVLFGFIRVVYDPLKYLLKLTDGQIQGVKMAVVQAAQKAGTSVKNIDRLYQVQLCGMDGASGAIKAMHKEPINFNFLGIDLTKMLNQHMGEITVWIIPVLAVLATIASSYVTKKLMAKTTAPGQPASMGNSMLFIMPVMTAYFTFVMPIGMSLYWFTSTVITVLQQIFTNVIIKNNQKEIKLTTNDQKLIQEGTKRIKKENKDNKSKK